MDEHGGRPAGGSDVTRDPGVQVTGEQLGHYELRQRIGEGGMGEVWLAEQRQPIRRTVALKLIKAGMDSRQVVARFEAERQALALMDHPGIAKVFDAGVTDKGRAFFVMEYVRGEPLTAYCDRHRLSMAERLQLFVKLCEAVQHAHQKGVIHRDLKPSNVLVTIQDDRPVPKIIDFGIAKATAQRLTEKTVFTELGVLIGTPEYMSPEQAEMTGLDVDTRTDVYSLGVMLYELLAGVLPFTSAELRAAGLAEIRRRIREVDPPRPSTKVGTLGDQSTVAAHNRRTEPRRLASQLKGDLDWIAMKALDKDRTRRYGSVSELAADITRHLSHQAVVASPPSTAYRARKFVRRHRLGVTVTTLSVIVLIAFAATMAVQARRIARERDRASHERDRAERVSAFLVSLFQASDPDKAKSDSLTAHQILDRGVQRLEVELRNEPDTRATLLHSIGRVYRLLGRYDEAEHALEEALSVRRAFTGRDRVALAATLSELGNVRDQKGDYARGETALREALDIRRVLLAPQDPDVAISLNNLAGNYVRRGEYARAESLYREGVAIMKATKDPGNVAKLLLGLGTVLSRQGQARAAADVYREGVTLSEQAFGHEHTVTLAAMNNLGHELYVAGDYAEAERLQREVLDARRKLLGPQHFDVAVAYYNLGNTLDELGQFEVAERTIGEALAIWRRTLPDPHEQIAWALNDLGIVATDRGQYATAERFYSEALSMFQRVPGADPVDAAYCWHGLGDVRYFLRQFDAAEKFYRTAVDLRRVHLGPRHRLLAYSQAALARLLIERGSLQEAEDLLREAVATYGTTLPNTHWWVAYSNALLGDCLARRRQFPEAERLLVDGYRAVSSVRGEQRDESRYVATRLVALYDAWGRVDAAAQWRKKTLAPQ